MTRKKKLMVVLGAGASIELGMPSVNDVDALFHKWSGKIYKLANDNNQSLYSYIRDEINRYYRCKSCEKSTNFEEVLYVFYELFSVLSDGDESSKAKNAFFCKAINAFFRLEKLPEISYPKGGKFVIQGHQLIGHCLHLIDKLVAKFRNKCQSAQTSKPKKFEAFRNFVTQLHLNYDVAFVTLNYDNLITQVCPDLFTGFDKTSGEFDASSVRKRSEEWGLIYHLHGSIHFDMRYNGADLHAIKWESNLGSEFSGSKNRSLQLTPEGILPTSIIVAGYGKTTQIQKEPFRTYYAQMDGLVESSEAILFLGYGFNDFHINNCFRQIGKGVPIVVVDWAPDNKPILSQRIRCGDLWSRNLCEISGIEHDCITPEGELTGRVGPLKEKRLFEIPKKTSYCPDPPRPLAIWYGGFIEACKNYPKIQEKLG